MKLEKSYLTGNLYNVHTAFERFLLYKICYPIVNKIGLNRKFNLWRHRIGFYNEYPNGLCMWCGDNHRGQGTVITTPANPLTNTK